MSAHAFPLHLFFRKDLDELVFEYANCSYHFGPIVALDAAVRKPLLVTAGVDRFIRVWNYMTMTQEIAKEFAEEAYCISFHPTGYVPMKNKNHNLRSSSC